MLTESQEQYLFNCDTSLEKLRNFHCPIYAPDKNGNPIAIGTGVLIDIDGYKFLVSAGHVFDYTYTHRVAIKSKNKLVNITGDIIENKYSQTRKEDKIDLAILILNEKMEQALSDYNYLKISNIDYNHISNKMDTSYTFIGFPATKNKTRYNTKNVKGALYSYTASRVKEEVYKALGITTATHIAITFNKRKLLSTDKKKTTVPDPYAMSGGGIWLNDNLNQHPSIYKPKIKLVGIALSWHKKYNCLMGVSTSAVLGIIKENCNITQLNECFLSAEKIKTNNLLKQWTS